MELIDVGVAWFEDAIGRLTEWFEDGLATGYEGLTEELFNTPTPETGDPFVFGTPENEPWTALHDSLVAGEIMLLGLLLLACLVQARHTIRIFNVGSASVARKTKRSAWTGAVLIVTWYWLAVLVLYLVDGFTIALLPGIDVLMGAMIDLLTVSVTNPVLGLLLAGLGGVAMWVLQALLFIREILLYVFVYAMPVGLAVAFGGVPVASRIARGICMQFIPLALLPLPVALFFTGYELLFAAGTGAAIAPESAFLRYLVVVSLPVLSVLIIWKLFTYASPLTARVLSGTTTAAVGIGTVAGAAAIAGPSAAATATRWGPKAAVGQAAARRLGDRRNSSGDGSGGATSRADGAGGSHATTHDNVVTDAHGQQGVPQYRRTENDPGYH